MYNRYIPQSDGTYKKNYIPESRPQPSRQQKPPSSRPTPKQEHSPPCPHEPPRQETPLCKKGGNAGDFLKGLLPKDLDTGDLLIILLLLLMAGDSGDEKNTALLTLALYLFL